MMAGPNAADERLRRLSGLLLDGELDESSVDDVVKAGLASYALHHAAAGADVDDARRPPELAEDPRLQRGKLLAGVRHKAIRQLIVELVAAWHEAGIETLLYKGFMLAEFVYPDPTWRAYSDVDVALRSSDAASPAELAAAAADVARRSGWQVIWRHGEPSDVHSHHDASYDAHELLLLHHRERGVNVDAHRRLVHNNVSSRSPGAKAERITRQVWAAAERRELDGTEVRIPTAADSALVGLIAGRSWSGDRYQLRPHDLLDLKALFSSGTLDRDGLMRRAGELDMTRTARLFLRRCDPLEGVLDLRTPRGYEVFLYDTLLMGERGHRGLQRFAHDLSEFPSLSLETARALFIAVAAAAAAPEELLGAEEDSLESTGQLRSSTGSSAGRAGVAKPLARRLWRRSQVAVRRALKILGTTPERERTLALHVLATTLARRGHDVRLVRREGRAWLEHAGRPLRPDLLGAARATTSSEQGGAVGSSATPGASTLPRRLARIGLRGAALRAEALVRLVDVRRRLRSRTFKEVRAGVLGPFRAPVAEVDPERSLEVGRAVESAARFVPGALCLAQSLVAQAMLTRRGVPSTIHVGFLRSEGGQIEGHAWLEGHGQVVTGDIGLDRFTRTATFEVPEQAPETRVN